MGSSRQNTADNADGLAEKKDGFPGTITFEGFAFDAPRPLRHVIEIVGSEGDLDAGEVENLALLFGDGACQRLNLAANAAGDLTQSCGALDRGTLRPLFLCRCRSGKSRIDIGGRAIGHGGQLFAVGGIDNGDDIFTLRRNKLAINKVLILVHVPSFVISSLISATRIETSTSRKF